METRLAPLERAEVTPAAPAWRAKELSTHSITSARILSFTLTNPKLKMGLEDFERELATDTVKESRKKRERSRSRERRHRHSSSKVNRITIRPSRDSTLMFSKHSSSKHHRHHKSSSHHDRDRHRDDEGERSSGKHKRSRREYDDDSESEEEQLRRKRKNALKKTSSDEEDGEEGGWVEKESYNAPPVDDDLDDMLEAATDKDAKRDAWMEAPSALDIDYVQRKKKEEKPSKIHSTQADYDLKIHKMELNTFLKDAMEGIKSPEDEALQQPATHEVDYEFGDAGSSWRMTKLKAVYNAAKESRQAVEEIALERFGSLREFDDAREEEIELDRRNMYGRGYVGKIKPSGELFEERKLSKGIHREPSLPSRDLPDLPPQGTEFDEAAQAKTVRLDQTALNKLKAQMMKAKLKKDPNAATLEAEYNAAMAVAANTTESDVVVLSAMDNRMLTGGRKGEVVEIGNKRGRERGLVNENEDMSIEDMVRQERRTKTQNNGLVFAERIAKDGKFDVRIPV